MWNTMSISVHHSMLEVEVNKKLKQKASRAQNVGYHDPIILNFYIPYDACIDQISLMWDL